jgi:hypothetical protein
MEEITNSVITEEGKCVFENKEAFGLASLLSRCLSSFCIMECFCASIVEKNVGWCSLVLYTGCIGKIIVVPEAIMLLVTFKSGK